MEGKIGAAGSSGHEWPKLAQFGDGCISGMLLHGTGKRSEPDSVERAIRDEMPEALLRERAQLSGAVLPY